MKIKQRDALFYKTTSGNEPAKEWLENLRDKVGQTRIYSRIRRSQMGHFGDYKQIKKGLYEMRVFVGPGYRVYFSIEDDDSIILLLMGGDKSSQEKDIKKATAYLDDHRNGGNNG